MQKTLLTLLLLPSLIFADLLSDKKNEIHLSKEDSNRRHYKELNLQIEGLKYELKKINHQAEHLSTEDTFSQKELKSLLSHYQDLKCRLKQKQEDFKKISQEEIEPYSFMHESEITLEQFIIEYASFNHLYVIPPEMGKLQLSLCSNLAIPKASWEEIVELVCHQNGISIKSLNPFVKVLYWSLGNSTQSLKHITSNSEELNFIEDGKQVCFVLSLSASELNKTQIFLKKFINERYTSLHTIGNNLILIGEVKEVKELTKLLGFIKKNQKDKCYRLIPITKMNTDELKEILLASFDSQKSSDTPPINIISLKGHLVVLGSEEDLNRCERMAQDLTEQMACPNEMSLFWYHCKYSDPQDLASLLQQVYDVMTNQLEANSEPTKEKDTTKPPCPPFRNGTIPPICDPPNLVVNPKPVEPAKGQVNLSQQSSNYENFIVDGKSGQVIMVVRQGLLDKMKELAKKIDIPKKMVQIEILLFEKKVTDQTQFGLNLLQMGSNAEKLSNQNAFEWTVDKSNRSLPGIMNYFFTRSNPGNFPAFNFAYNFLISQEDVFIHSSPTITTINQTPAKIDLVEEQSINMGTVEDPRTSVITNTFVRAQYGIVIEITPTINQKNHSEDNDYITLDTNITFDTETSNVNDRPDIARRHIQNQVRIANNETLILGGLRRKNEESNVDKIPFLGDIPGVGKLFSFTTLNDKSTEMFIFITPRIIEDPKAASVDSKTFDFNKRQGDSEELLKRLIEAKTIEKRSQFKSTFSKILTL